MKNVIFLSFVRYFHLLGRFIIKIFRQHCEIHHATIDTKLILLEQNTYFQLRQLSYIVGLDQRQEYSNVERNANQIPTHIPMPSSTLADVAQIRRYFSVAGIDHNLWHEYLCRRTISNTYTPSAYVDVLTGTG
jgi:hypothetical protein